MSGKAGTGGGACAKAGAMPADRHRLRSRRRRYVMGREDGCPGGCRNAPLLWLGLHWNAEGVVRAGFHLVEQLRQIGEIGSHGHHP